MTTKVSRRILHRGWLVIAAAVWMALAPSGGNAAESDPCVRPTMECPLVASLLKQREGYGRFAAGGLGGTFVTVTSAADDGPGSLREAITQTRSPRWIRFNSDMTIDLKSQIQVPPNVTIDGRDHHIVLHDYGFGIYNGSNNVIITHVTIDGEFKTFSQAINIANFAHDVWIDHTDLSRFNDRLVNVKNGATDVTLSWIKFHNHNKVMLLNNLTDKNLFANFKRDSNARVTIHHSYFVDTVQRNPRAQFGVFHIFNNLLENWDFYGMSFSLEARATVMGNIFVNSASRPCAEPQAFATIEKTQANYCEDISTAPARTALPNGHADEAAYLKTKGQFGYQHDFHAFLKVRDNLYLGDAKPVLEDYRPELVPPPPYCSSYQKPSLALAEQIRREAGNTKPTPPLAISACPAKVETKADRPPLPDQWRLAKRGTAAMSESSDGSGERRITIDEVPGAAGAHGVVRQIYGSGGARWTVDLAFKPIGGRNLGVIIVDLVNREKIAAVCGSSQARVLGRGAPLKASATSTALSDGFYRCTVRGTPGDSSGNQLRFFLLTSAGTNVRPIGESGKGLVLRDIKIETARQ